nr:pre-peptidase C-terminal domain-containing protein [Chloroflexota bacterium]
MMMEQSASTVRHNRSWHENHAGTAVTWQWQRIQQPMQSNSAHIGDLGRWKGFVCTGTVLALMLGFIVHSPVSGADTAPAVNRLFVPVALRSVRTVPVPVPWQCAEPANETSQGACGPLLTGVWYYDYITPPGTFLARWGSLGVGDGQFWFPCGVAVAPDGTLYVADTDNDRVQRFSATGAFLGKWGSPGAGDGQFWYPCGVAVAPDGTVYVADTGNDRIQAFGIAYPTTWRGEYFANRWLAERPILIRQDAALDFQWGTGSPGSGVPADNFSARWQRYVPFAASRYRFTVFADDGVRLWVDDTLLIEQWQEQVASYAAEISLSAGYHRLLLEYYEAGGSAALQLRWTQLGPWREFLPVIKRASVACREPDNDRREGACGPLLSGQVYRDYISSSSDECDWFYFDMPVAHTIEAWLREIPSGCDYDLYLRGPTGNHLTSSAQPGNKDEHISWGPLPAGRYYLLVVRIEGWHAHVPYALRVEY